MAIGACHFLGALNVYIGRAAHVAKARAIAKQLRATIRLPRLKALGLGADEQAQVAMNAG